ncbi:MYCT-like protein [Mya arenaria]|uniref:MYCT-like protein n=1 Tax=Mya arenaria TaxID=6604 RepID=A0ABY7FY17_MYAAR|nr:MYCT-like protein [Mya arenaria]
MTEVERTGGSSASWKIPGDAILSSIVFKLVVKMSLKLLKQDGEMACNDCMMDLSCGYCFADNEGAPISNSSCLPIGTDNPWVSGMGQCSEHSRGKGPMPWTINSEIYPLWCRSSAISVATFTNWTFNPLVSITFITLTENLTRYQ